MHKKKNKKKIYQKNNFILSYYHCYYNNCVTFTFYFTRMTANLNLQRKNIKNVKNKRIFQKLKKTNFNITKNTCMKNI